MVLACEHPLLCEYLDHGAQGRAEAQFCFKVRHVNLFNLLPGCLRENSQEQMQATSFYKGAN
jgi:hypothetical protein